MATSYLDALGSSFSLIIVSEIGDKTFFIASLLAMQNPQRILDVFLGATTALLIMTILSTMIGTVALNLLSPKVTTLLSSIGLIYFAVNLCITLYLNEEEEESELEEVEKELKALDEAHSAPKQQQQQQQQQQEESDNTPTLLPENNINKPDRLEGSGLLSGDISTDDEERHRPNHSDSPTKSSKAHKTKTINTQKSSKQNGVQWDLIWKDFNTFKTQLIIELTSRFTILSPLFIQCCILTFIAEWGDRSQIATILLASAKSPVLVTIGCISGHMICTGLAIFFGKVLSTQLNDRHLQAISAVLFMAFGVAGLWDVFTSAGTLKEAIV